jgi:hypothetical protein
MKRLARSMMWSAWRWVTNTVLTSGRAGSEFWLRVKPALHICMCAPSPQSTRYAASPTTTALA